jgi:hypothetical protein
MRNAVGFAAVDIFTRRCFGGALFSGRVPNWSRRRKLVQLIVGGAHSGQKSQITTDRSSPIVLKKSKFAISLRIREIKMNDYKASKPLHTDENVDFSGSWDFFNTIRRNQTFSPRIGPSCALNFE